MLRFRIPFKNFNEEKMFRLEKFLFLAAAGLMLCFNTAYAQTSYKWMNVGSLHSFYYDSGCEIEVARPGASQQDGLRWPGIYRYQDMEAAKGLWIGAKNFTDEVANWPYRVIHVGPRVSGVGEIFPTKMKMYSKFEPPVVEVDGVVSEQETVEIDSINPAMPYDRLIINEVNNLLGLTMHRKIFQFSDPYFDNFIVQEYTYTNTGNTDKDADIELPDNDLQDVVIYYNYRWAMCAETRYVIGNGSGWGMNTMNDVRGDGLYPDPPGEEFRTAFAWHGFWPSRIVTYDNMGAPIWVPDGPGYVAKDDTVGRLGAPQFMGVLTLHADKSATDPTDDLTLPYTRHEGSDIPPYSANDAFNLGKMTGEYKLMTREDNVAEQRMRHAYVVHPAAIGKDFSEFANQRNPPEIGTPGGYSSTLTFGPYQIPFGESIRFVIVEGAAGLSREKCVEIGKLYKRGLISDVEKNVEFLKGKDSLMQTWQRVSSLYQNDWNLSGELKPPSSFSVKSDAGRISLKWDVYEDDPNVTGFEIYRATGKYDSTYYLVHTADRSARAFADTTPVRGLDYYYYILTLGQDDPGDPSLNIPPHKRRSSRYYTQTYDPAQLRRAAQLSSEIRVVPNPYNISASQQLSFSGADQLAFFGVPANCTIKIYSELGELIDTIEKNDPSGDVRWFSETSSKQIIVSGIYIAVITDNVTGEKFITKFAVIR